MYADLSLHSQKALELSIKFCSFMFVDTQTEVTMSDYVEEAENMSKIFTDGRFIFDAPREVRPGGGGGDQQFGIFGNAHWRALQM